jgi:hypothetical protein
VVQGDGEEVIVDSDNDVAPANQKAPVPELADLKAAMKETADSVGLAVCVEALKKFKAKNLLELTKEQYAPFLATLAAARSVVG